MTPRSSAPSAQAIEAPIASCRASRDFERANRRLARATAADSGLAPLRRLRFGPCRAVRLVLGLP
jgi:hypothetical protein